MRKAAVASVLAGLLLEIPGAAAPAAAKQAHRTNARLPSSESRP